MATFTDLDSTYRNRNTYPNPANYTVEDSQVRAWSVNPRTVSANSARPGSRALEFVESIDVERFILPYTDVTYVNKLGVTITVPLADIQRVYLDVHTSRYNDQGLISTIDNKNTKAKFMFVQDKIQEDTLGNPRWIHYKCKMNQVMRFARNEPIIINIMQELGYTIVIPDAGIDPDPLMQTYIMLKITPYFRDGGFNNSGIGLITTF
jgi:hypothetical protein